MKHKTKPERLAEEWSKTHQEATIEEAYIAGYLRHVQAWVKKER